jgi:hypothetical protein
MADLKISQLPVVTEASAGSVLPIVQGGVTSQIEVTDLTNEYIRKAEHSLVTAATTQTINLGTAFSLNIIVVSNSGLTLTLQFPTSPVDHQVCQFTTLTNTVTIAAGTGTFNPVYTGAPVAGFSVTYVYHIEDTTWYKISS